MTAWAEDREANPWNSLQFLLTSCLREPVAQAGSPPGGSNTGVSTARARAAPGGGGSVAKSKEGSAGVTRDIPAAGSGRAGPGSPALRSTLSRALVFAVRVKPVLWVMFPPKGQSSLGLRS